MSTGKKFENFNAYRLTINLDEVINSCNISVLTAEVILRPKSLSKSKAQPYRLTEKGSFVSRIHCMLLGIP
jgi:hypothetical protein